MLCDCLLPENYKNTSIPTASLGLKRRLPQLNTELEASVKKPAGVAKEVIESNPKIRISADTEIDIYGKNAFLRAAEHQDEAEFQRLLKQRLTTSPDDLNFEDYSQRNALILASMSGNESFVQQLLETRVMHVDSQDMAEFTALMYAAQIGHKSIVEQLLSKGADYRLCNINGDTAIILAARRNRIDCLKVLARFVKSSTDWTVEGECGLTAEQWAETNEHVEAAEFIRKIIKLKA